MLCETMKLIMRNVVDDVEMIQIHVVPGNGIDTLIQVAVATNDLGKAIGKNGRMAEALRQIIKSFQEQHGGGYRLVLRSHNKP